MSKANNRDRNAAALVLNEAWWHLRWLREHPKGTSAQYRRLSDQAMNVWRRNCGERDAAPTKRRWLKDHPEQPWFEHQCVMTEAQREAYAEWESRGSAEEAEPDAG